jgi:peptidyl-prolyl cis-trans isomerase B (cyclophilin B)
MGKSGKRVGKVTPPRSMDRENKDNRMWWWVGGGGALILVAAAVIWFAGGPRGAISETPAPSATEEETSSMPENPSERNGMYDAPPEMEIDPAKTYLGTIATEKGHIVVELDPGAAPETVNNFVFLARGGFYDNLTFHRVVPDFVIQGGDPLGSGTGGPGYTVPAEIDLEHVKGAVAMARRSDDVNPERASSGSQFYITLEATPHLDGAYTVFGEVVEGMDVVESIAQGDVIESITISEER